MPRKTPAAAPAPEKSAATESVAATIDTPPAQPSAAETAVEPSATADAPPKNWGPPYKAIFTSAEKGFELGENRRFKQRVFTFKDKPDEQVIATLKENGFTYRAAEKAWTVEANAESRVLTDRLAREFAGAEASMGRD